MVGSMLDHTQKHALKIVLPSGCNVLEPTLGKLRHSSNQLGIGIAELFERALPTCTADLGRGREVLFVRKTRAVAGNASQNDTLPSCQMQHDLPNAVRTCNRMRGRSCSLDSLERFQQRRSVPGFTVISAFELVSDQWD